MSKSKNYLWHPILGKRAFSKEHAQSLLKLEEKQPSGWVEYNGQDAKATSNKKKDAANDRGNKGNSGKKTVSKSDNDTTGDSPTE